MGPRSTNAGWSVDVLADERAVAACEDPWDHLARAASGAPFTLPAVAMAWWRHLGKGRLRVTTVRDRAGALRALAPLHERRLGPAVAVRWLGTGLGSVCEVVAAPGDGAAASAVWSAIRPSRDVLDLVAYPAEGAGLPGLRATSGVLTRIVETELCPVVDLALVPSAAAHIESRRYLRKKLNRYDRILAADGRPFSIEVVTTADRLLEVLPDLDAVYDRAEEARPRQHLLRPPWRAFTLDAMQGAAVRGQLAVFLVRLGDRPVAFDICFVVGRRLANWVGRFDPDAAEISPGHLLLRRELEWALDQGLGTLDLLVGDDEYKQRWATGAYGTVHVLGGSRAGFAYGRLALAARERLHGIARSRGRAA